MNQKATDMVIGAIVGAGAALLGALILKIRGRKIEDKVMGEISHMRLSLDKYVTTIEENMRYNKSDVECLMENEIENLRSEKDHWKDEAYTLLQKVQGLNMQKALEMGEELSNDQKDTTGEMAATTVGRNNRTFEERLEGIKNKKK